MSHIDACRRGFFDAAGKWFDGPALNGLPQWHSATCEGALAQVMYGRERAITVELRMRPEPESFMFDTLPSLDERAMRFGMAMRDWIGGAK